MSRPVWGAWIEIRIHPDVVTGGCKSRPVWGAWIEIAAGSYGSTIKAKSRPVWGAWIEIMKVFGQRVKSVVAPRMGRVD